MHIEGDTARRAQVIRLRLGDSFDILRGLPPESIGSIVTDPPYGLEFMSREFDSLRHKWVKFDRLPPTWLPEGSVSPETSASCRLLTIQGTPLVPVNQIEMVTECLAGRPVPEPVYEHDMMVSEEENPEEETEDVPAWMMSSGFTKPGIGDRKTAWPSFSANTPFGTANPTCAVCGGRLRGQKKCSCDQPHEHWKPSGPPKGSGEPARAPVVDTRVQAGKTMQGWHRDWLKLCFAALVPGGVVKIFSATRTYHRLAMAMEEAGFTDITFSAWCYASGFPKSLSLEKAIDAHLGKTHEREVVGHSGNPTPEMVDRIALDMGGGTGKAKNGLKDGHSVTTGATEQATWFTGWGTALKPAYEPILTGRKPG